MKFSTIIFVIVIFVSMDSYSKEPYVVLKDYVKNSEAICICTVEKDNGDGTVTIKVEQTIKGKLGDTEVLKGETGHCVMHGPVSHFMKPKERYLVFLFKDKTVGRLGGILRIQAEILLAGYITGFKNTTFDKEQFAKKLPLKEAIEQINAILKEETLDKKSN